MSIGSGKVAMYWLFKETNARLDSYAQLVREAKALDEAAAFCRFVLSSRLCDFLDEHPGTEHLPCDGLVIRRKTEKLLLKIQRRWERRDERPHIEMAELVQIRAELVALRRHLGIAEPILHVVEGGFNG